MDHPLAPLERPRDARIDPETRERSDAYDGGFVDHARAAQAREMRKRGGYALVASVACFAVGFVAIAVTNNASIGALAFAAVGFLASVGAVLSLVAWIQGVQASAGVRAAALAFLVGAANVAMALLGALSAFLSTMTFTRGRQIRSFGRILLPPVRSGASWTTLAPRGELEIDATTKALDAGTREALAAQWRENGRTEHASVAAFARLTLDLVALGAPPELVAAANRDALDEIRHAELCFALARELDGRAESPASFPEAARARTLSRIRSIALAQLAVDSLVDGALHEGVSARIVAKLARRAEDRAIAAMMKEIAADEGRHARHGWDVVMWCVEEGGEPVARAVEGALRALPSTMSSPIPAAARDGRWERFGIMGEALEEEEHRAARADLERRVRALVERRTARAA